jgi:hypothetical protein
VSNLSLVITAIAAERPAIAVMTKLRLLTAR